MADPKLTAEGGVHMGVGSRGDGETGDTSPRIWNRRTLIQIVPLRFCHIAKKTERFVTFKIRHNPFSAGAAPVASLGGGRTAPGDTLQGLTPERNFFCGEIYKE